MFERDSKDSVIVKYLYCTRGMFVLERAAIIPATVPLVEISVGDRAERERKYLERDALQTPNSCGCFFTSPSPKGSTERSGTKRFARRSRAFDSSSSRGKSLRVEGDCQVEGRSSVKSEDFSPAYLSRLLSL